MWAIATQHRFARSSTEAEIVAIDEVTKATQAFSLVLEDLSLSDSTNPTPVYVDNQATIMWSHNQSMNEDSGLSVEQLSNI